MKPQVPNRQHLKSVERDQETRRAKLHRSKTMTRDHRLFPKKLISNQLVNQMQPQNQARLREDPESVEIIERKLEEAPTQLTHSL